MANTKSFTCLGEATDQGKALQVDIQGRVIVATFGCQSTGGAGPDPPR